MRIPEIIGAVILIIVGIVVTFLVASQDPKNDGISSLAGAGSFLGSDGRDRSVDARVNKLVKVLCGVFFVVVIAVTAMTVYL